MNTQNKKQSFILLALLAILTLFASGRWNFPLAGWIATIIGIRFYRQSEKGKRAFLLIWLATAVPTIIAWQGATAMYFIHPVAETLFFGLMAPITLLPYVIDRSYYRRLQKNGSTPFWVTLVFPIAVAAMDFFSASGSPFGTFGAGAYSQSGFTALMQITSITGIWGIPFIVAWFGSVVNYFWENDFRWTKIRSGAWIYAGFMILVLGFGFGRMLFAPAPKQDVLIAGFSLPEGEFSSLMELSHGDDTAAFQTAANELNARQIDKIRTLAQSGAKIVVLQEGASIGYPEDTETLLVNAAEVAQSENVYIVLPTLTIDPTGETTFKNMVQIIDPSGEIVLEHIKFGGNLFEGSLAGSGELQTVDTPYGKLSAVICWDADFSLIMKQAGEKNVDLLFIPSEDWFELRDIHADMATFRAIENGTSIFRHAGAGVSSVTDAYGRIVNRVDMFETESNTAWSNEQMVLTPIGSVETTYSKIGDAFGQIMLLTFIGLSIFGWLKRKKA